MKNNWKLGPQSIRFPSLFVVELLANDMGGELPLLIRYKAPGSEIWDELRMYSDGKAESEYDSHYDLMPPKMTRKEFAQECRNVIFHGEILAKTIEYIIDYYDRIRREGRVEE